LGNQVNEYWNEIKGIERRKDFAFAVQKYEKIASGALFSLYDKKVQNGWDWILKQSPAKLEVYYEGKNA
jgi:hypothetical protein